MFDDGSLKRKIIGIMAGQDPAPFWSLASVLWAFSKFYQIAVGLNRLLFDLGLKPRRRLPCKMISVGNITVGGTGKTPMTIYLARLVQDLGFKVAVISRGYKGKAEKKGAVVSDGEKVLLTADIAGDEPYMMAGVLPGIPVIVGRNRYTAGRLAIKQFKTEVIVLDDGFQHLSLERDLNLVLVDSLQPWGNGHLLPRGPLRETPGALKRADSVICMAPEQDIAKKTLDTRGKTNFGKYDKLLQKKPCFDAIKSAQVEKVITAGSDVEVGASFADLNALKGRRVVVFSGLANNEAFIRTVSEAGCELVHSLSFDDHHRYEGADINKIVQAVTKKKADLLVTTAKDYARNLESQQWPVDLIVLTLEVVFVDKPAFGEYIRQSL